MSSLITNLIWIDSNIDSNENKIIVEYLSKEFSYLNIIKFKDIKLALNYILNIKYKIIIILISGRFYNDYINSINANLDKINCIPISIIFTSMNMKNIFLGKDKSDFPLSKETIKSINDPFYNPGGIYIEVNEIFNFLESYSKKFPIFYEKNNKFNKENNNNNNYYVENNIVTDNLILHSLINKLIKNENYNIINIDNEIKIFKDLLINYLFDNENIYELFFPLIKIENIPFKIL